MSNPGRILEHIPELPDLMLFWVNDVSDIQVSRCGLTRGMLCGRHVSALIWMIMTGGLFKIVSNWAVLTTRVYTKYIIAKHSHVDVIYYWSVLILKIESQKSLPNFLYCTD